MTYAREIEKGEPNDLQVEAARRRLIAKTKQTPQPPPPRAKAAKTPSPPPAKAAAAASAYPPLHKASAKVAAKTPKVVNAASASSAPQGPPPTYKKVKGPNAEDMGPEAMRSTDPAFWMKLNVGLLHDQLAQRGYKNTTMSASAFGRLNKTELVRLILLHPPPAEKP